jgi:hypothetical protein
MGKYEFTWAIRPPPSRRRRGKQMINGFEVEITFSRIDVRTGFTDLPEDQLRKVAEEIAANLVRAVSFHERKRLTAVFRRVTCTSSTSLPTGMRSSILRGSRVGTVHFNRYSTASESFTAISPGGLPRSTKSCNSSRCNSGAGKEPPMLCKSPSLNSVEPPEL